MEDGNVLNNSENEQELSNLFEQSSEIGRKSPADLKLFQTKLFRHWEKLVINALFGVGTFR